MTVDADVHGAPLNQTVEFTLPKTDVNDPEIERMWAWHRVERLMAEDRQRGSELNAQEIVRLCEGYSIVSQYASFIVLENDAEYQRWQIARRNATRVVRDRAAQQTLRNELEKLRQQAAANVGPNAPANNHQQSPAAEPTELAQNAAPAAPSQSVPGDAPRGPRGRDLDVPTTGGGNGSGGGGAIDPFSGAIALAFAAASLAASRRRRKR